MGVPLADIWREDLRWASDKAVAAPLWDYPPVARSAVLGERRRRFGIESEYINPELIRDDEEGDER